MADPNNILSSILDRGESIEVGILLFPDVEVLDFAGPFEVFSVAARIWEHDAGDAPPFRVSTVAADVGPVIARHGLRVLPRYGFDDAPAFDIPIVPGGVVTQPLGHADTLRWVSQAARTAPLIASVCTGAFILAELGMLDGLSATTHWDDVPELRRAHPQIRVLEDVPFVDEDHVVTSAGISAGIEMSLHLVGRVLGRDHAIRTARQMQYDWDADQRPPSPR